MIGEETKRQIFEKEAFYRMLSSRQSVVTRVAIGMFTDFIDEKGVRLIGVEPAGRWHRKVVNMVRH